MTTIKPIKGIQFAVLVAALGFSSLTLAAVQVDLAVNGTDLTVSSNTAQCSGGPVDCIDVKSGTNPHLYFNLKKACKRGGPEYKLAAFRIGMQSKVWPTSTSPLPAHIAADFNANPVNGFVYLEQGSNELHKDKIKLKDHNRSEYTVYYDVYASHCTDVTASDIRLDPQIRNGGNN